MHLLAWFFTHYDGIDLSISLKHRYLAYIALLAGWLFFCYWLYAKEIFPRLHAEEGIAWPVFDEELKLPLAFYWGSDIPHAGDGFDAWTIELKEQENTGNIIILRSTYYRDEAASIKKGIELARDRAKRMIHYLDLSVDRLMIESVPGEVNSDFRSKPFEALYYEILKSKDVVMQTNDTIELCFPVKDSFNLPAYSYSVLDKWLANQQEKKEWTTHIVGIADGTGISESADIAWERAILIKERFVDKGWQDERIIITTGQRSLPEPIRNRCVLIYFE